MPLHESIPLEVTVVMPCLNEADTLATCIRKALTAMSHAGIAGEVVVADNGSTDDSAAIARAEGVRLVPVADRGYGAALMGGIGAAHGRFVIMSDADESYDFGEVPRFVERLREGYDLVQGCRLESGGGRVLPGLAHAPLLPDVHAAPALPDAGADPRRLGHCRICSGHAGDDDRAHDLRRAHAPFRESRGDLRKPEHAVCADREDIRDYGRGAAARSAHR
jgi:glycosyltransferase involved in cell wall biosynthesis